MTPTAAMTDPPKLAMLLRTLAFVAMLLGVCPVVATPPAAEQLAAEVTLLRRETNLLRAQVQAYADQQSDPRFPIWLYGAEPGKDITKLAQPLLDQGRHVMLPAGTYRGNLVLPFKSGGSLKGAGSGAVTKDRSQLSGQRTRLIAADPSKPIITVYGTRQELEGLTLDGQGRGTGLLITKPSKGLGTGKLLARDLFFNDLDIGVQTGLKHNEHNCDECDFSFVEFNKCGVAHYNVPQMGMGHSYHKVILRQCPVGFRYPRGGSLTVNNLLCFKTVLFDSPAEQDESGRQLPTSGRNNGVFTFRDVKVDAQHRGRFMACKIDHPGRDMDVRFYNVQVSGDPPALFADMGTHGRLTVVDGRNIGPVNGRHEFVRCR